MRVKTFLINLGWIECWLQVRLGRSEVPAMRRYQPVPREHAERTRNQILQRLVTTFCSDRSP